MLRRDEIRVWGEAEDKEELYNLIIEREDMKIRRGFAEIIEPPLIINILSGLLNLLILLRNYLQGKREKNITVGITLSDGKIITITSKDFQELNIIIDELSHARAT